MKPKPQKKNKRASNLPTQPHWYEMNRKQRRQTMRKIQSEDLSLEVIHSDAAGIDIGNEIHYAAVPPSGDLVESSRTARRRSSTWHPQTIAGIAQIPLAQREPIFW
jgi:hypothetical protein